MPLVINYFSRKIFFPHSSGLVFVEDEHFIPYFCSLLLFTNVLTCQLEQVLKKKKKPKKKKKKTLPTPLEVKKKIQIVWHVWLFVFFNTLTEIGDEIILHWIEMGK